MDQALPLDPVAGADPWTCDHARRRLFRRRDLAGRIAFQEQCVDCRWPIPGYLKRADVVARIGDPERLPEISTQEIDDLKARYRDIRHDDFDAGRAQRAERYHAYLQTPEWRARREAVMGRERGRCQGCLVRDATQVHHLTYAHVGAELLFELVALCDACHERTHHQGSAL